MMITHSFIEYSRLDSFQMGLFLRLKKPHLLRMLGKVSSKVEMS